MISLEFYSAFKDRNESDSENKTKLIEDGDMIELREISLRVNLVLIVIGIIGNLINIYVFCNKIMMKKRFNSYLLSRAIFELIFCLILFIDYILINFNDYKMFLHDLNIYSNIVIDFLVHTVDSYITYLSFVLSFDRLWAIKYPTEHKNSWTYLYPKSITLIVLLISILIKIPGVFACNDSGEKKLLTIAFCTFISPLICNVIPSIAILVVNIALTIKMNRYYKNNQTRNSEQGHNSENRRDSNRENIESIALNSNKKPLSSIKKSHYVVIIITSFWIELTTLPYYTLNYFNLLSHLNMHSLDINIKLIAYIQVIVSIFFNSNRCVNFFIYFSYHIEFRNCIIAIFKNILSLFQMKNSPNDEIEIQ